MSPANLDYHEYYNHEPTADHDSSALNIYVHNHEHNFNDGTWHHHHGDDGSTLYHYHDIDGPDHEHDDYINNLAPRVIHYGPANHEHDDAARDNNDEQPAADSPPDRSRRHHRH